MDSRYSINTYGNHPETDVMLRKFPDPRYAVRNMVQYGDEHISDPGSELSRRTSFRLYDMVQAPQRSTSLSNGSSYHAGCGFFTPSKPFAPCYDTGLLQNTDSLFRLPVSEFGERFVPSRSSSLGLLRGQDVKATKVTASHVADHHPTVYHPQQGVEKAAALTGLVMEKILRDHFQDASEPKSSCLFKGPAIPLNHNAFPTFWSGVEQLGIRPLVESAPASCVQISECEMSPEPSPSQQLLDGLAPMTPSEFPLAVRHAFGKPVEETHCGKSSSPNPKWTLQRSLPGACAGIQDPSPSFWASNGAFKSKVRPRMGTDAMEQACSKSKKRRTSRVENNGGSTGEAQRMTHIAVERNRRKQMNEHLSTLKDLMPSAFIQKTDQASIIGGAIEFVKDLQSVLESLQSEKRRRAYAGILGPSWARLNNVHPRPTPGPQRHTGAVFAPAGYTASVLSASTSRSEDLDNRLSSKRSMMSSKLFTRLPEPARAINEVRAEQRSPAATVEVKVFGNDAVVNVTTYCRPLQLVKVILALERLDLHILQTRVTTSGNIVLYTFKAEVGPGCRMTVDQAASAIHQTFTGLQY